MDKEDALNQAVEFLQGLSEEEMIIFLEEILEQYPYLGIMPDPEREALVDELIRGVKI